MVEPITKSDFAKLLQYIYKYQHREAFSDDHKGGNERGIIYFANDVEKYEDISTGLKNASPLMPLFTSLAILDMKTPESLTQEHLDIFSSELHNLRSKAFHELHQQQKSHVTERLQKSNLILEIPTQAQNAAINQGKENAESFYHLSMALTQLAATPLDDVKAMMKEIGGEKTPTGKGSSGVGTATTGITDSRSITDGSYSSSSQTSDSLEQERKREQESRAQQIRVQQIMQTWNDIFSRKRAAEKEKALLSENLKEKQRQRHPSKDKGIRR